GFEQLLSVTGQLFEEVPLGKGQVPWKEYIAALHEIGYDSWLTIEREVGADPVRDISEAVNFLKTLPGVQ
ncbi:MAG: sugar phosphate isomerase/epimerase, partial [Lentisphaeria bacterium]|nr:sugar phosphate isomerase/epimerase [Lentisphaeria bacterium]